MTQTRDISIIKNLSALIEAASVYKRCGAYSQAHPTTPLNKNPYVRQTERLHRRAFGSVKVLWGCTECRYMFPRVYAECEGHESLAGEHMGESVYCDGSCNPESVLSQCCDAELFFDDYRPRKQREAR